MQKVRKRRPTIDNMQERTSVLMRPILSESVPAKSLPPALKRARIETAKLAEAVPMPIISDATADDLCI